MMFMIPIPPTISEMPATLPNKNRQQVHRGIHHGRDNFLASDGEVVHVGFCGFRFFF